MLATAALLRRSRRRASLQRLRGARVAKPCVCSSYSIATSAADVAIVVSQSTLFLTQFPNTRIQKAIAQIDQNIGEDYQRRIHQGRAHDHRVVALEDRVDEVFADTWDAEDRLGDDRSR